MLLVIFGHTVNLAQLQLEIFTLYGILRSIASLPQATAMIVIFNRGVEKEARKTTSSSLLLVVFSTHTNQRSLTPITATPLILAHFNLLLRLRATAHHALSTPANTPSAFYL